MSSFAQSTVFAPRSAGYSLSAMLLSLLIGCGGGASDPAIKDLGSKDPPGCDSVPSAPKTEACAGGQIGTHTFQTETASCSVNNGKIIVDDTSACVANTSPNRIALALKRGDTSVLNASDHSAIISQTAADYQSIIAKQNNLITAFYEDLSTKFDLIRDSYMVQSSLATMDTVTPLVVGDKGNTLASISTMDGGRIAGYGYDILAGFVPNQTRIVGWNGTAESPAKQADHQPVFKRVIAWLVSGDPKQTLAGQPASNLNIAWSSLPTSGTLMYTLSGGQKVYKPYAVDGLAALNIPFTNLQCDPLSAPIADCAAKAQLVVIGAYDTRLRTDKDTSKTQTQLDRIKAIVEAKIPILYLNSHPDGGATNDYARATWPEDFPRLDAMGFANGDTPDRKNLSVQDSVGSEITIAQLKARNDPLSGNLIARINTNSFKDASEYDWTRCAVDSKCTLEAKPQGFVNDIMNPLAKIKAILDDLNQKGQNVFDPKVGNKTLQMLIMWADTYRKNIVYPINKLTQPVEFQKAYIADALVAYVRDSGSAQPDLGNFLSPDVRSVKGNAERENVTVTLSGGRGFTSIGRMALPGQALTVQLQNKPAAGTFRFFLNTASEANTKLYSSPVDSNGKPILNTGYRRPRLPQSPKFTLSTDPITIVSPYGGLLQLEFSGATDDPVVLQIKGAAKQPFYDTTQGTRDASAFLREIQNSKLGWFEIKTPDIEIHSPISKFTTGLLPDPALPVSTVYPNVSKPYFNSATQSIDLEKYVSEASKYITRDAFQLYGLPPAGLELSSHVLSVCVRLGWDCTSPKIHKKRPIQHFHIDYAAACGSMCSTDPITSSENLNPRGWGESHELGHLLVRFKVYDWKTSETANNIYPLHKKWRMLVDLKRDAVGYYNDLSEQQLVFEALKNAYHAPPVMSKFWAAEDAVWNLNKMPEGAFLNFYTQWPLLYANILRNQNSDMPETDAIEAGWSIYALMHLHLRQISASSNWLADRNTLGFSTYGEKPSTSHSETSPDRGVYFHHDYLLVALSLITGYDQLPMFKFWGISTNEAAQKQVAALRGSTGQPLPPQPLNFYATRCSDDFRGFRVIDMTQANAEFPWADQFRSKADVTPSTVGGALSREQNDSIAAKQRANNLSCLATGRE